MSNAEFYSFLEGIKELAKTKKPDERIVVDIYDPYGRKLKVTIYLLATKSHKIS